MKTRQLGHSGLSFAPLMFGGNVLGWTTDRPTSFAILDAFLDAGFSAIDTADVYASWTPEGVGTSERVLGEWFALGGGRRERVILATKVGLSMGKGKKGLSRAYIREAVDASLQRLRTDRIDLYQTHADDPDTPQEETLDTFAELIRAGKVRAIGASNTTVDRLCSALEIADTAGLPRFVSIQPLYNLYDRAEFEAGMQALAIDEGLGVIPYFALASGFLTGKYRSPDDLRPGMRGDLVGKYLDARGYRTLAALDLVAARHEASPAQIALAWLMAQPGITAPIVSATSLDQLGQIIKAGDIWLTDEDRAVLDSAAGEPD
ncbi:MAG: aldo/keto reductase [Novosphingobium sp.]|nr:aldo/keto reductase [Novosphingobium sp.]